MVLKPRKLAREAGERRMASEASLAAGATVLVAVLERKESMLWEECGG